MKIPNKGEFDSDTGSDTNFDEFRRLSFKKCAAEPYIFERICWYQYRELFNYKIRDGQLQYDSNRAAANISALS